MKNVLVTGGAGFIGSHLCEGLLARGYNVRVLDSLVYGRREWVPAECEFIEGDIRDSGACQRAAAGMQGVFHCAAMSRSGPSQDLIDLYTQSNITGTQNMLLAARDAGVKRLSMAARPPNAAAAAPPQREATAGVAECLWPDQAGGRTILLLFDEHFGLPAWCCAISMSMARASPKPALCPGVGIFCAALPTMRFWKFLATAAEPRFCACVMVAANIAAYKAMCG